MLGTGFLPSLQVDGLRDPRPSLDPHGYPPRHQHAVVHGVQGLNSRGLYSDVVIIASAPGLNTIVSTASITGSCVTSSVTQHTGTSPPIFGSYNVFLPNTSAAFVHSMQDTRSITYLSTHVEEYIKSQAIITPPPIRKGDYLSINIDDQVHQMGVREHANSLIAKVLLKAKVEPMSSTDLRAAINEVWEILGNW